MKWGRKNLIISWIYKLKRIGINSASKPVKEKQNGKKEALFYGGSVQKWSEGEKDRFFGGEDDGVCRLSFGEKRVERKSVKATVRSVLYEADDEAYLQPLSSFRRKALPEINTCSRELATLIKTPRITDEKNVRISKRGNYDKSGSVNKHTEADWRKYKGDFRMNAYETGTTRVENEVPTESDRSNFDRKTAKEAKIEQIKSKSKQRMNSVYLRSKSQRRMTRQNSKVGVFSPRTAFRVETCKIRALEDMKKAKLKMKVEKEIEVKGGTELESFPVVKCSFDPRKDFRESMIEMILEKNIYQPEELEELLVCYLTLNSDEYHDLIVKVFRQIWIDLIE